MFGRLARIGLSGWIFLGLALGLLCGLFFGELCTPLNLLGKVFIKLLQMAVLPYMVFSLIHGVGSLSPGDARIMATRGALILGLFWVMGLVVVYGFSLAFPSFSTSSFFSVAEPRQVPAVDLIEYYIPTNIVAALSKNMIPAIVLFSVFLGIALLRVPQREPLLNVLAILTQGLNQMTHLVMKTAPLGIFALTASAAGTISLDQLQRLQIYFVCYILAAGILVFWVIPMLVTCFTAFSYRDVIRFSRDALILGFTTGNNFVVLPVIADRSKQLFANLGERVRPAGNAVDSVLPLAYSFPSIGKVIEILFILFVSWYANQTLGIGKQIELAFAGVLSLFGSPKIGIPFLLDYMELPGVYFDLYMMADVVTRKFKMLMETMSMMGITLIVSSLIVGAAVFAWKRVLFALAGTLALLALAIGLARIGLTHAVDSAYREDRVLMNMEVTDPVPVRIVADPFHSPERLAPPDDGQVDILKRIETRGRLRVGFDDQALPFAFHNARGELVGYDILFAHRLARNLGVGLDLLHLDRGQVRECLNRGLCDIVMSAYPMRLHDLGRLNFSRPYMEMKSAFVLKDFRKKEFQKRSQILRIPHPRIAVTPENTEEDRRLLRAYLPNASLVELDSVASFFTQGDTADALLTTDIIGKTWALLYPDYGVVVPAPPIFVYDLAYPIALTPGDDNFLEYVNHWLTLEKTSGELARQFDYWILGKTPERNTPRWSIIRNVLHWID